MELLLLFVVIGFLTRGTWDHAKANRAASRDQRMKEVAKSYPKGALPKSRQRAAARQHAAGWWAREVRHGFPVTKTGWHAAWLAHKAQAHAHETRREEASADAAEAEVARTLGVSGARQRRAAAQAELDKIEAELAAQQAKGSPATGRKAVQSAADEVARRREQKVMVTDVCPSCGAPDGYEHLKGCDPSAPPLPADGVHPHRKPAPNDTDGTCIHCGATDGTECATDCPYRNMDWRTVARNSKQHRKTPPADDLAEHLKAPMPDPRLSNAQRARDGRGQRNLCAACGRPGNPDDELVISDGWRVHQSHTADPASGFYEGPDAERVHAERMSQRRQAEGIPALGEGSGAATWQEDPDLPDASRNPEPISPTASPTTQGAPMTADTNYDVVMENARKRADEAEQDAVAAAQRHTAAQQHAEDMQAVGVQGATLSAQMELVDQLKHAEDAAKATGEQAVAVRDALAREHGGIKGAVDDAPIARPAETDFYVGS